MKGYIAVNGLSLSGTCGKIAKDMAQVVAVASALTVIGGCRGAHPYFKCESKGENKMSNQFEFEPAYYLASVTQYVSDDGRHYIVGPIWECAKKIDGKEHFPVVVARKGMEGCVYWCREKSRGSSGNFEVEAHGGDFRLADNSFCHSDETAPAIYAEFVSGGTTNKVALERKDMDSIDYPELPMSETRKD